MICQAMRYAFGREILLFSKLNIIPELPRGVKNSRRFRRSSFVKNFVNFRLLEEKYIQQQTNAF